jgi:hypothetical protein
LISGFYDSENTRIGWPLNNKRNERLRTAGVTTQINSAFGAFQFGFRFIINDKRTAQEEGKKTHGYYPPPHSRQVNDSNMTD